MARLQETLRSPTLDTYFAVSANLGTHTFYMIMLPVLFWCGRTSLARGYEIDDVGECESDCRRMSHILALGVFFSGFVKDLLCLPRPLSPPLQRITMSGSAALEYGFPSTHSTNAVSVAVYSLYILIYEKPDVPQWANYALQAAAYFYAFSIMLGRLYCGMHGFLDVIWGSLLGAGIAALQCLCGDAYDSFLFSASLKEVAIVVLVVLVLVRLHPEPVDDCPCFDDSVAFAAVTIGIEAGNWHFSKTIFSWADPYPATVPFKLESMGWPVLVVRIFVGVLMIFAWRGLMKPTLLRILPPIFRIVEQYGLTLPRRFFKQASEYQKVPYQAHDDNIIPHVSEIPQMLTNLRRRRAVSIGPQSEADAYETMAYREKTRRDSMSDLPNPISMTPTAEKEAAPGYYGKPVANGKVTPRSNVSVPPEKLAEAHSEDDRDLFKNLTRPRVRYDVEVITKLVVYSGKATTSVDVVKS